MRIWMLALLCFGLVSNGQSQQLATVKITVSIDSMVNDPGKLYMLLYSGHLHEADYLGNPLDTLVIEDQTASIQLPTGYYCMAAVHPQIDLIRTYFYVNANLSNIQIIWHLSAFSYPEAIEEVEIIGDFCRWQRDQAVSLRARDDIFELRKDIIAPNERYKFIINHSFMTHHPFIPLELSPRYANYHHRYQRGEILFKTYQIPIDTLNSWVLYPQNKRMSQFNDMVLAVDHFVKQRGYLRRAAAGLPLSELLEQVTQHRMYMDSLENVYDKGFMPFLLSYRLQDLRYLNRYELHLLATPGEQRTKLKNELLRNEEVLDEIKLAALLLDSLDPNHPMIDASFIPAARYFQDLADRAVVLQTLPEYFQFRFIQLLEEKLAASTRSDISVRIIKALINHYTRVRFNEQKARYFINRLIEGYPTHPFVTSGKARKWLSELSLNVGYPAPRFYARKLNGEVVSMDQYEDKYLLLVFWATWSGPSKSRMPELSRLDSAYQEEDFEILALAHDNTESLSRYLLKNPLPFDVATGGTSLQTFQIDTYPTNFVINPQGIIVARNLWGDDLKSFLAEKFPKETHEEQEQPDGDNVQEEAKTP